MQFDLTHKFIFRKTYIFACGADDLAALHCEVARPDYLH